MLHVRRATATIAAAAALTMGLVGCGGDEPDPIPSTSPSASTSASPSASPSADQTAWRSKYNEQQLAAYDAALQRFQDYESRSEPIWNAGKATPAAEELFKEYYPSPQWRILFRQLQTYERVEVTSEGQITTLSSRATTITKDAKSVIIEQCVDYTTLHGSQRGKPVVRDAWMEKPQLRTIHLSKPAGHDWLIYEASDLSDGKDRPCTA